MTSSGRNFKNWLQAYLEYTQHSESPDTFHFWTGVVTIGGVLRRRVWIDERFFQWTPNFYVVFVAPPGAAKKSTTVDIGLDLLREVDSIHIGPQSISWQGLMRSFQEAFEQIPYGEQEDIPPAERMYLPMSCLTCVVSELGTFLRPESGELVDNLTAWWDGKKGSYDRALKGEGTSSVENLWLNVMACTTPGWMKKNYSESLVDGGLTSRIIFVAADKPRHHTAYLSRAINEEEHEDMRHRLIEDLQSVAHIVGEYKLTEEAYEWGEQWYEEIKTSRPIHMASERYSGYIERKQTHTHKLAMVLAAAQRNERIIELDDLQTANRFISGLEADMNKVFQSIGMADIGRKVSEILAFVKVYKEVPQQALYQHCVNMMGLKEFEEAVSAAVKAGYLELRSDGKQMLYRLTGEK